MSTQRTLLAFALSVGLLSTSTDVLAKTPPPPKVDSGGEGADRWMRVCFQPASGAITCLVKGKADFAVAVIGSQTADTSTWRFYNSVQAIHGKKDSISPVMRTYQVIDKANYEIQKQTFASVIFRVPLDILAESRSVSFVYPGLTDQNFDWTPDMLDFARKSFGSPGDPVVRPPHEPNTESGTKGGKRWIRTCLYPAHGAIICFTLTEGDLESLTVVMGSKTADKSMWRFFHEVQAVYGTLGSISPIMRTYKVIEKHQYEIQGDKFDGVMFRLPFELISDARSVTLIYGGLIDQNYELDRAALDTVRKGLAPLTKNLGR